MRSAGAGVGQDPVLFDGKERMKYHPANGIGNPTSCEARGSRTLGQPYFEGSNGVQSLLTAALLCAFASYYFVNFPRFLER